MAIDHTARDTQRPYPPTSNVVAVLQRLRSRNLPDRIDAEYLLDTGIAESLVQRVAFGLRFLKLTQGDTPTPALRSISTSTDEEYRDTLAGLIREAYADVFAVIDPAVDNQERIVNVFRKYSPASQRGRMVSFFLGMCREAGIPTLEAPRQRAMSDTGRTARPQAGRATAGKAKPPTPRRESAREERDSGGGGIPPVLEGLIRHLPVQGETWSADQRRRWLALADAALTFAYPEPSEPPIDFDEENDAMES